MPLTATLDAFLLAWPHVVYVTGIDEPIFRSSKSLILIQSTTLSSTRCVRRCAYATAANVQCCGCGSAVEAAYMRVAEVGESDPSECRPPIVSQKIRARQISEDLLLLHGHVEVNKSTAVAAREVHRSQSQRQRPSLAAMRSHEELEWNTFHLRQACSTKLNDSVAYRCSYELKIPLFYAGSTVVGTPRTSPTRTRCSRCYLCCCSHCC